MSANDRSDVERRLGRYRAALEDWDDFAEAMRAPLPTVVWANPERLDRDALAAILDASGVPSEPVGWEPHALRLPTATRPGKHWAHWAGLYYVQEEASLVPVRALDPRPGERVLDLCAAPGSKTARIAFALGNRGTVVANDRNAGRLAANAASILRLGLRNVTCTAGDGTAFPLDAGRWDAVLVDAPCSGEGTPGDPREPTDPEFRRAIAGTQRALLRRAARLCRPGGRIVYSTCTLAPEENEAVIDDVLARTPSLRAVPVPPIAGLPLSEALPAWDGRPFAAPVRHARRLWPHRHGTDVFFVALLDKDAAAPANEDRSTPVTEVAPDARESATVRRFARDFGIPLEALAGHRVLERGRYARLVADDHRLPAGAKHVATGLTVHRNHVRGPKLATGAALWLGPRATRRLAEVDPAGAAVYQAREPLPLRDARLRGCERDGYVVLRVDGHALGLGQLRRGHGAILSEFPKAWSRQTI
ncbi:MAG TPA: RsmB/NOP family class I SAM-dependent RNA methyltransferase [Sandaracinaceae bacterium LLY-WYZ-13_1]|nr:RsmB/NOP family class I SAM-dependent RNA methyltransferase [Sandaracinaceae bacterium LLY-WYZ-13_1]